MLRDAPLVEPLKSAPLKAAATIPQPALNCGDGDEWENNNATW